MEKKRVLTVSVISVLLMSAVAGTQFTRLGRANPVPTAYTEISIENPKNTTYNVNTITFCLFAETNRMSYDFFYSLDGKDMQRIGMSVTSKELMNPAHNPQIFRATLNGSRILSNLSGGIHNITAYHIRFIMDENPENGEITGSAYAEFLVDTISPKVTISLLENKTYSSSDIKLDFTVNELASLVTYSLDGQENVTINANTTLTGLSEGEHNVTVYASDEAGNIGASETIYFRIESFPTTLVIASVVTMAVIGIGLLGYFKKRQHSLFSFLRIQ